MALTPSQLCSLFPVGHPARKLAEKPYPQAPLASRRLGEGPLWPPVDLDWIIDQDEREASWAP